MLAAVSNCDHIMLHAPCWREDALCEQEQLGGESPHRAICPEPGSRESKGSLIEVEEEIMCLDHASHRTKSIVFVLGIQTC